MAAQCRQYFGSACNEALVNWLPQVPDAEESRAAPTSVRDEIVDPAGTGERRFLDMRGVYGGTFFVREAPGGPPRGHVVYDPLHRIAYYDEGCCSLHHVVISANVPPPPKKIVMRSLAALRTVRGIRLGAQPSAIQSIYGPATLRTVPGAPGEQTITYARAITRPAPNSVCTAYTTFLFFTGRLTAIDFNEAC
jgi:hypothetical protein